MSLVRYILGFTALLCLHSKSGFAQDSTLHVEVSMAARGFMCPFLTPMVVDYLEEKGAHWLNHDRQASTIEFAMPLDSMDGPDALTRRLVLIGYEERHVGYSRFDPTTTIPAAPEP